ncbi:hypothetical protein CgunFtcFv8_023804 [Champsocephalus gunnari]|uniref:Uncharacterized protein n=1 Tax=Champsocephalus gunnari TaxID=52237 RepID=A0AAN8DD66_CHAGU|nr:hypothetical protein CgunFtcFv8_023804 [Champsocephalus gunnari]
MAAIFPRKTVCYQCYSYHYDCQPNCPSITAVSVSKPYHSDSIPLHCEPDASWLFMADARVLRPLSSAHTWLLWDEVTTPILARTLQTPWKQCCFTSHRLSKNQTRITNLVYNRAGGKAPGYICQLLRLDPLHGG